MMRSAFRGFLALIAKFVFLATFLLWGPFFLIAMCFELHFLPSEFRLKRGMRAVGRFSSPAELRQSDPTGTLILDFPTFSWGVSRLWYTSDDVLANAPMPHPSEDDESRETDNEFDWHPFDRWCCTHYLSPESGCANLIGVWHCERLASQLADELKLPVVRSFSGGRFLEQFMQHENRMKGNDSSDGPA